VRRPRGKGKQLEVRYQLVPLARIAGCIVEWLR